MSNRVDRGTGAAVMVAVAVGALAVRLVGAWRSDALHRSFGFDESVYFLGAQHLIHGELPYRDFLFVHPPGMLLGLTPFAWLAEWTGDSFAMTSAKVLFAVLGATCAALISFLLLRFGVAAALVGGGLYAAWSATASGETMLMMGVLLNLALLVSLLLLRERDAARAHLFTAGAVLGLALTVKLWAAVPIVVLAAWILLRHRRRGLLRYTAGMIGALLVVVIPFLAMAGAQMYDDVVGFQADRPRSDVGFGERVFFFTGSLIDHHRLPSAAWWALGVIALAAVSWPILAAIIDRRPPHDWDVSVL